MLVLSRKLNEKIVIDGGVVVTVVKIDRNQIRLGIEAPAHVRGQRARRSQRALDRCHAFVRDDSVPGHSANV
jgi:carbon storage regulator CsrA